MTSRHFLLCPRGSASVEFALMLPLLLILLFGGIEAGHFVWTQHKLAEAVRDGARYGWTEDQVVVRPNCGAYVSTGFYAGYAADFGAGGPVVSVAATNVAYPSMFNALGIIDPVARLSAHSNSPGIGL